VTSLKATARKTGALYLIFALGAIFNEFYVSAGFVVRGDPAATAQNISAAETTYRIGILSGFGNLVIFVFLVVSLHELLKSVDGKQALLMVIFVILGITLSLVNLVYKSAPLIFQSGADYLSVFSRAQLETLSFGFHRLRGNGATLASAFWGLWLFPFGILVLKSQFIPKIFGILLIVAGFAYLIGSVASLGSPVFSQSISKFLLPLYSGEVPIIFWLLIRGAKVVDLLSGKTANG